MYIHLDVNAGIAGNIYVVNECLVFVVFCGGLVFSNSTDCFMPTVYATVVQSNVHIL